MGRTTPSPAWAADVLAALPPLVTRARAREILCIGERTLDRRLALGDIRAIHNGRRVLIPRQAIVDYLARGAR